VVTAILVISVGNMVFGEGWNVGILVYDGVYNTEFVAPLDVFDHAGVRSGENVNVFLVSPEGGTIQSAENLQFKSDNTFSDHPRIDILVIPSFANYESDLGQKPGVIEWIRKTAATSKYVLSNCWGAFFLAKAGLLDNREAMTFPPDIDKLGELFPKIQAVKGHRFVRDGKFVTGGGGVASYDNSLYIVEQIWGANLARDVASGLVMEWDLKNTPHRIAGK